MPRRARVSVRCCKNGQVALGDDGQEVDTSLLKYLSPLGWEHINLTGDYVWCSNSTGKFRPLRPLGGP